jgi:hypothetical protein
MLAVRYVLPLLLFVGGILMLVLEPNSIGIEGFAMATGAALSVLLLNWLYRAGVKGDHERTAEDDARKFYARTGRWPED